MPYSKEKCATICSWVARAGLMMTFTLPVLSLYGEGEAQQVEIYEAQGDAAAVEEPTVLVESLEAM